MEFEAGHYMAMAMFLSFIVLIFTGYPVAWLMGGLAMIFTRLLHKLICIGARNASVQVVFRILDGPVHVHSQ